MRFEAVPYFRHLATKLKALAHSDENRHFTRVSSINELDEFLANAREIKGSQLIVHDHRSGRMDDSSRSDNILDKSFHTFYVVEKVATADYDAAEAVKSQCLLLAYSILSRMLIDKRRQLNGLKDLEISSIHYDTIGPIAQGYFGVMVSFSLLSGSEARYSPSDWLDG